MRGRFRASAAERPAARETRPLRRFVPRGFERILRGERPAPLPEAVSRGGQLLEDGAGLWSLRGS
jgi:hypothetical protein